jgi:predicted ABC-type ATPase
MGMNNGAARAGRSPSVVVLSGPNGSGKSTVAAELLRGTLAVTEFVNADTIAQGLSGFAPEGSALEAGKVMIRRLRELARRGQDFAFETTLASRHFAPWLRGLRRSGYAVRLVFLWLPGEDLAVRRVAERVRTGGHGIPEETIRRRYRAGLRNLFALYQPICVEWRAFDNSQVSGPRLVARGAGIRTNEVVDPETWALVRRGAGHA